MEKENKNLRVPKETKEDYNYDRIRALVSASGVPFATDIFGVLFTKPIEKRRKEFLQSILDKIEELSKNIEKFEPENLQKNEVFLSTLVKSCQSILNEHQKIKIDKRLDILFVLFLYLYLLPIL